MALKISEYSLTEFAFSIIDSIIEIYPSTEKDSSNEIKNL